MESCRKCQGLDFLWNCSVRNRFPVDNSAWEWISKGLEVCNQELVSQKADVGYKTSQYCVVRCSDCGHIRLCRLDTLCGTTYTT